MTDTLWYTRCPVPTAFSVAIRNGWIDAQFAPEGIAVRSLATTGERNQRQSHFGHTQPNFFRHGGNTPPLFARSRGTDVRLIGLSFNQSLRVILVRPDSSIRTVGDLANKRISIPRRVNDTIDFWRTTVLRSFTEVLESEGLSLADTIQTEVAIDRAYVDGAQDAIRPTDSLWGASFMLGHQREEALALIRGEVDAIYSQGSIGAIVEAFTGARTIFHSNDTERWVNNDAPLTLTVSGALLDERPDIVDRWLEQVLRAAQWSEHNELEAKRTIAIEAGIPEDLVARAFAPTIHQQLAVGLDDVQLDRLESQHAQLLERGFIDREVDFSRFVDPRPLAQALKRVRGDSLAVAAQ